MEKIDWKNPPQELRFVVDLKNGKVDYISDDINHKGYDTKTNIKKAFACGSKLVNIAISESGPFSKWALIPEKDHVDYIEREKMTNNLRHLTYKKI